MLEKDKLISYCDVLTCGSLALYLPSAVATATPRSRLVGQYLRYTLGIFFPVSSLGPCCVACKNVPLHTWRFKEFQSYGHWEWKNSWSILLGSCQPPSAG